jgi:hypothetical protein
MIAINRTAFVVRPGKPFLDWLHRVDPTSDELTLEDLQEDPTVYLLRECEGDEDPRTCLEEKCGEIFEEQLDSWYIAPSTWPNRRDLEAFERWFEWSSHSMVFDLCDDPILLEDL